MSQFSLIPDEWYVHPCYQNSKEPMLKDWPNQCQPMGSEAAAEWVASELNLGIVAGKSGLVVVDIDPRNGGKESQNKLYEQGMLPDTVTTATPTGGFHLYYLQPPGEYIGNPKSGYPGIDIKGHNGYVIAPGSIHPNGGEYVFLPGRSPEQIALQPCPKWLADLRFRKVPRRSTQDVETEVIEGSRNDALTSIGGALQRQGLSGPALEAALQAENIERCNPPLPETEVSGIVASISQYDRDRQRPATKEFSFEDAINGLTRDDKAGREAIYQRLLNLDDEVLTASLLEDIAQKLNITKSIIRREFKPHKDEAKKAAKREKARESEGLADDLANAVAEMVILPKDDNGSVKPSARAFVIQEKRSGEKYLYPFWNDSGTASAAVSRTLYSTARKLGNENIDIAEQYLGNNPLIREARTRLELRVQEDDGIKHVMTSAGPFYDRETQRLFTKTDLDAGVIIYHGDDVQEGAILVEKGPLIERREDAFEKFKAVCGNNWEIILAHCIAALAKIDDAKHALIISAARNSGKSTLARLISHILEGKDNMINGTDLKGLWPKIFSSRSIIFDNVDKPKSFADGDIQTLIGAITSGMTTVEARFTKTGISAELGFPIFTTILSDPFQYEETLMDRSILINHEFQEALRDFGDAELKALANEFRPHLWYLVDQYIQALPELPKAPGGIRQKCFASAMYWLKMDDPDFDSEAQIDEFVKCFKYERDTEGEDDPFITALDSVIKNHDNVTEISAGECVKLMKRYDIESCRKIVSGREKTPLDEHPRPGYVFKQRFEKAAAGDRIGDWRFTRVKPVTGEKRNQWLYTFYRDTS